MAKSYKKEEKKSAYFWKSNCKKKQNSKGGVSINGFRHCLDVGLINYSFHQLDAEVFTASSNKEYLKFLGTIFYEKSGVMHKTVSAFWDIKEEKLSIPEFNIVMNPSKSYVGPRFWKK